MLENPIIAQILSILSVTYSHLFSVILHHPQLFSAILHHPQLFTVVVSYSQSFSVVLGDTQLHVPPVILRKS